MTNGTIATRTGTPRRRGSRAGTAIGRLFEAGARGDILDGALSLPADLRTLRRAMT